ncbi:MAG: D-alanyl-D-alanine carboxypeptidase/D-alanyl-D-alanine-endopeptidase [Rubrivivax sp.]|nr:D-alanyl-D-alanine carboxypeptidase/D-alanyl-D-alanine-endopeptidase [Rubrivivax sp.]
MLVACALAAVLAAGAAVAEPTLPPAAAEALERARVPRDAFAVVVHEVGRGRELLEVNGTQPMNPASLVKLLTTASALEMLGPAWQWTTPVWLQGTLRDGVLDGSLVIRGSGDPSLVVERLWLLLRQVQQRGVREIRGDIVLDASAFELPPGSPADFDGQPLRPYNVRASALLFSHHAVTYGFVPDPAAGVARVTVEPELARTAVQRTVPLAPGPCDDWAARLEARFEPGTTRFLGRYPAACGTLAWPVADPEPATYNARLIEALWASMGGRLGGRAREGSAPSVPPTFEWRSPPLAAVVRDINKFSNNVMAQQLFLTLALQRDPGRAATPDAARQVLARWVAGALASDAAGSELPGGAVLDNGSGLSRTQRLSARQLATVLMRAFDAPTMPELLASLPVAGQDGTMRRARVAEGRAHLKTGSLDDVVAVAGFVRSDSGRRYVLVALVQHERAQAARPALDALIDWVARDAPAR